jgi:hypothetical protein
MSVKLITSAEAAAILQITPDYVRRLARAGQLAAAVVVGVDVNRSQRLFDRAVVQQFARDRKQRRRTQRATAASILEAEPGAELDRQADPAGQPARLRAIERVRPPTCDAEVA